MRTRLGIRARKWVQREWGAAAPSGSKLKVFPISWFNGGKRPFENPIPEKLKQP